MGVIWLEGTFKPSVLPSTCSGGVSQDTIDQIMTDVDTKIKEVEIRIEQLESKDSSVDKENLIL